MRKFFVDIVKFSGVVLLFPILFVGLNEVAWKLEISGNYEHFLKGRKTVLLGNSRFKYAFDDSNDQYINLSNDGRPHFYQNIIVYNLLNNETQVTDYYLNFDNTLYISNDWAVNSSPAGDENFSFYLPLMKPGDFWELSEVFPLSRQLQILLIKTVPGLNKDFLKTLQNHYKFIAHSDLFYRNLFGFHEKLYGHLENTYDAVRVTSKPGNFNINQRAVFRTLNLIKRKNKNVVFLNTPINSVNLMDTALSDLRDRYFKEIKYLNFQASVKVPDSLFHDGVHLNSKGSLLITRLLLDTIRAAHSIK